MGGGVVKLAHSRLRQYEGGDVMPIRLQPGVIYVSPHAGCWIEERWYLTYRKERKHMFNVLDRLLDE